MVCFHLIYMHQPPHGYQIPHDRTQFALVNSRAVMRDPWRQDTYVESIGPSRIQYLIINESLFPLLTIITFLWGGIYWEHDFAAYPSPSLRNQMEEVIQGLSP